MDKREKFNVDIDELNRRINEKIKRIEDEKTWTCSRSAMIDYLYFLLDFTILLKRLNP